jgi:hypothetical protein
MLSPQQHKSFSCQNTGGASFSASLGDGALENELSANWICQDRRSIVEHFAEAVCYGVQNRWIGIATTLVPPNPGALKFGWLVMLKIPWE